MPRILPSTRPIPYGSSPPYPAWCADKLREAWDLNPDPASSQGDELFVWGLLSEIMEVREAAR
jgi:hypothetical protein